MDNTIYGWPSVMGTALAAKYAAGSKWKILRAVAAGELHPAGIKGRGYTFTKDELDRWLRGKPVDAPAMAGPIKARTSTPAVDQLERLDRIRRGGGGAA